MKKQIYLIDLAHQSKLGLGSDTMPLQLGLIGAYCLKKHGDQVEIKIFKLIDEFVAAVIKQPPFIIAASNYMWNIDLTYKFITAIKEKYPKTIIIFGGPNYPDDFAEQVTWLKQYPLIDFYINKDGELPFAGLVEFLLKNQDVVVAKKAKLPSCHSLINGRPYFGELLPRPDDLSIIPSPYTTGLMDKFFKQKFLPTIQTNRGCPFTCTYCTEGGKYYCKISKRSFEHKKAEIDYIVKRAKYTKTLRITDSNFAMYAEDEKFCKYLSRVQQQTGYPEYVACSTGKNQKERILKCNQLLKNAMRLTASVQSLNKTVLRNINRLNISLDEIIDMSDAVSDTETHSYSEIILGLPGDSLKAEMESMAGLMQAGISNITQHQLALIYGAQASSGDSRKKFGIKSMFRPIQRCIGIYSFGSKKFPAIEIEEISVASKTMSFRDYLEARKVYLTIGLFYNDRIFGEIHALLRLLNLSTWQWIKIIHDNIQNFSPSIKDIYKNFVLDTKNELWNNPQSLIKDVTRQIDQYASGKLGGNLIYKYRSKAIVEHFPKLRKIAFEHLHTYLNIQGVKVPYLLDQLELFSKYQKENLFDTNFKVIQNFDYDLVKMIKDAAAMRQAKSIKVIQYPVRIRISHSAKQIELIERQLKFYGQDNAGLTMLMSRFPIKRFYRQAKIVKS
ncbi:MAG: radical SAM protein [Candidatus Kuenenbacteria bacterium]